MMMIQSTLSLTTCIAQESPRNVKGGSDFSPAVILEIKDPACSAGGLSHGPA